MFCPNRECVDFEEIGEPGEYRDDIEVCPKCGARLVHERPELRTPEEVAGVGDAGGPEGTLVAVAAFNYRQDADLAASMLLGAGLNAVVFGDDCGTVDPGLGFATRCRLMVPEGQANLALTLLAQETRESGPDEASRC